MKLTSNFLISTIFILLIALSALSQTGTGVLTGKVYDAVTKQRLPNVNIILVGTSLGAASDINGDFIVKNIPPKNYQVKASAIGYKPVIKTDVMVTSSRPIQIDFQLREELIEIDNVIVTTDFFIRDPYEITSVTNFSYEEIRRAPGGFEDVVRALSVLPGVAQADAGRNDLIVRGGAPSENLYIVDGIVAQNINHFGSQGATGGPLSYINLDFVKETSFSTGGFSAKYGDKLSSVLTIDLRNGRKDKLGGKITISATQFGINAEGPVNSNSTFLFSARRSYLDFIFKAAGFGFVPEYYDVLSKFNYNINPQNSFSFLFISAFDNVKFFNDTPDKRYSNAQALGSDQIQYITGFSFRHLFDKGFFDISLSRNFIDFNTLQRDTLLNPVFQNKSREGENVLSGDLVYKLTKKSELNFGATAKLIRFKTDVKLPNFTTSFGDTLNITSLNSKENFWKYDFYAQYSGFYFNKIRWNFGVRFDYSDAINTALSISPRFSISYLLSEITSINFSTGIYHQNPSYIWLAADKRNRNLKSIRVDQYILGFDHLLREDINLKVESFYKDYKDYPASTLRPYLVLANTGAGFAGADDNFSSFGLEPLVSKGKGYTRGIELSLQKKSAEIPHYGILSLTYSESFFTALDGVERPGSYDQKWILNLSAGYIFNERWEASLKFRFSTGKPYTPFNNDGTQSVAKYNSERVVDNHSLDIRIDRRWNFIGWNLIAYIDVQNIYNRKNTSFVRWDQRSQSVEASSSIGILPSIGISIEF